MKNLVLRPLFSLAGTYTVAISQFDNFAVGPNLSNGFLQSNPNFTAIYCSNGQFCDVTGNNRTSAWAFDILNVDTAAVPEPMTILGSAIALGFGTLLKRRFAKVN
jgi:hypothetical protein